MLVDVPRGERPGRNPTNDPNHWTEMPVGLWAWIVVMLAAPWVLHYGGFH